MDDKQLPDEESKCPEGYVTDMPDMDAMIEVYEQAGQEQKQPTATPNATEPMSAEDWAAGKGRKFA